MPKYSSLVTEFYQEPVANSMVSLWCGELEEMTKTTDRLTWEQGEPQQWTGNWRTRTALLWQTNFRIMPLTTEDTFNLKNGELLEKSRTVFCRDEMIMISHRSVFASYRSSFNYHPLWRAACSMLDWIQEWASEMPTWQFTTFILKHTHIHVYVYVSFVCVWAT